MHAWLEKATSVVATVVAMLPVGAAGAIAGHLWVDDMAVWVKRLIGRLRRWCQNDSEVAPLYL